MQLSRLYLFTPRTITVATMMALSTIGWMSTAAAQDISTPYWSCNSNGEVSSIGINELNQARPNQLILKAGSAYYQLINAKGQVLQDQMYDIKAYPSGQIIAKRNGYFGVIDNSGKVILNFNYDTIEPLDSDLYLVSKYYGSKQATALVDATGEWLYPTSASFDKNTQIIPLYFDETKDITYLKVLENSKYGLINDKKQRLIASIYDEMTFTESCPDQRLYLKVEQGKKVGLIDQDNKIIVPLTKNQGIESFNAEEQIFQKKDSVLNTGSYDGNFDDKYLLFSTLINNAGQNLVKSDSKLERLGKNLFQFEQSGKFGIITDSAKVVLPAQFDNIDGAWDGHFLVTNKQMIGIVSRVKKLSGGFDLEVSKYYEDIQRLHINDFSRAQLQALAVGEEYDTVVSEVSDDSENYQDFYYDSAIKMYIAKENGKYGILDSNLLLRTQFVYDEIKQLGDFLLVKKDNKYGMLTTKNEVVANATYDEIKKLESPYNYDTDYQFLLTKDRQQRLLDSAGNEIMPLSNLRFVTDKYLHIADTVVVEQNGKFGLFDLKEKNILVQPIFEDLIDEMPDNTLVAQLEGKKVLINMTGKVLNDSLSIYKDISSGNANSIILSTYDGKSGVMDTQGKVLIPAIYDSIESKSTTNDVLALNDQKEGGQIYYVIEQDRQFGMLDGQGSMVIAPSYGFMVMLPYPAYILVSKNSDPEEGNIGLINTNGKTLLDFEYDGFKMTPYPNGLNDRIYMMKTYKNIVEEYDSKLNLISTMSLNTFKKDYDYLN